MKERVLTILLVGLNLSLAVSLGRWVTDDGAVEAVRPVKVKPVATNGAIVRGRVKAPEPKTEFAAIYSVNTRQFVANLRAIGCPEETIKDILVAEIGRRYGAQEEALRPTP